jgi:hypothetical protein
VAQLGNKGGFLELRHGAEDLTNELGGRRRVGEIRRRVCRNQFDASVAQQLVPGELDREVTRKAAGVLDQHDADIMFVAMVEQPNEPGSGIDGVGARYGVIVKLALRLNAPMGTAAVGCISGSSTAVQMR